MIRTGTILLLLLVAAGCAAGDDPAKPPGNAGDPTGAPRDLRVEEIAAGAPGRGPVEPRAVIAPSAGALSDAIGGTILDRGEGTYLMAYRGEKPTGGYSLAVEGARVEGERVTIKLEQKNPPEGAILTQALTYPYVVAVVRGLDERGKEFLFEDGGGEELGWPVRRAGG